MSRRYLITGGAGFIGSHLKAAGEKLVIDQALRSCITNLRGSETAESVAGQKEHV